ncbi:MAG: hypothetical protein BGO69_18880 [Bacteroidetes bacterium 46-16]|nr:MAG: hypothetical protein BGO69_18880 [Bacteroidetes bacterium 46-16]
MPFSIEILTTDKNLIPALNAAIQPLNNVQNEFHFLLANDRLMPEALSFTQDQYTNSEIYEWLKEYKVRAKGIRRFVILVINKPLSGQLKNLFGGHRATEGFAWFTTEIFDDSQITPFLFDKIRFCRYYLVRYILSFVNPAIKSHPTSGCMFDDKIYKKEILLSLETGKLCDGCAKGLREADLYNTDIDHAIKSMLYVVSNQLPKALVMKGGGAKGLAIVGAIKVLEKYFTFDTFAGTSAGAVAATLLGAGYSSSELERILSKKNFVDFKDGYLKRIRNIIARGAWHSGKPFLIWLEDLLIAKLHHRVGNIKMKDLPQRTIVYASTVGAGFLTFDSLGQRQETDAAFATRCSMSIPIFFIPPEIEGAAVYDGGLGNNFPLRTFIADNHSKLSIGLYLVSDVKKNGGLVRDLMDIVTDTDERTTVDQNLDKIVIIDPRPIKTTQFDLTDDEKQYLLQAGKVGALVYLNKHHGDLRITDENVNSEIHKLDLLKKKIYG